jgi:hypothetical protein
MHQPKCNQYEKLFCSHGVWKSKVKIKKAKMPDHSLATAFNSEEFIDLNSLYGVGGFCKSRPVIQK